MKKMCQVHVVKSINNAISGDQITTLMLLLTSEMVDMSHTLPTWYLKKSIHQPSDRSTPGIPNINDKESYNKSVSRKSH